MGSSVSKGRTLPKATSLKTPLKGSSFQNTSSSLNMNSAVKESSTNSTMNKNKSHSGQSRQENKNADTIQPLRVHEVPLSLDQNHPSLKLLRNRTRLEQESKQEEARQKAGDSSIRTRVTPDQFAGILEDMKHYSKEQLIRNYRINPKIMKSVERVGMEIAETRVVRKAEKESERSRIKREEEEEKRINGVRGAGSGFEDALENLMKR